MSNFVSEAGTFDVLEVANWTAGKSAKSGTPYIDLGLLTPKGETRWRGFLTEKTAQKTLDVLMVLGFKGDDASDFVSRKTDLFTVPRGVTVTVKAEVYEGKTYYKAEWVNAARKENLADVAAVLKEAGFDAMLMKAKRNRTESLDEIPF